MSQAEELLNGLNEDEIALYSTNPDTEEHIVIDGQRNIIVPDSLKRIAVQYDNHIETVTFDCPRYWDNNDLSTMNIYINYVRSDSVKGLCLVKNVVIDEEDSNMIHFDWIIGDEITIVSGSLEFAISAKKMGEDEELRWYSEINTQMTVSKGLDNAEIIVEEHPDILNEILAKVDNMTVDNDVKTAIATLQTDLDALEDQVNNFDIPEQVQVDWNQNNSTQPDYIKNRVCYSEGVITNEVVILERANRFFDILNSEMQIFDYKFTDEEKSILESLNGKSGTLRFTIEDRIYERQTVINEDMVVRIYEQVGDRYDNYNISYGTIDTQFIRTNDISLTFVTVEETIVKLPEKYLPDTVATKEYVDRLFNSIVNGDEVRY